jgi:alanine-glyoxylate transaminase/serine-glyoxylate transaminase/serine-pyruvate transaminase
MTTPMLGYLDGDFIEIMDETVNLLRHVFGTENRLTLPVSGTGTAGMEAALCNIVEPGDSVVVGVNGYFGGRIVDIVQRCGGLVTAIEAPWGSAIQVDDVANAIKRANPKLVAIIHAETSTGVLQPLDVISQVVRESGGLFLTDCVTSLGGQPVELDRRGIDIAYSGTQKCLGGPPGLAPISFSDRAVEAIRNRSRKVQSFYLDMTLLEAYWSGDVRNYHHTVSMSLVYALHESLRVVLEEGLEARYARHVLNAKALVAGAVAIGLKPLVQEGIRAPMLTTISIPDGIDDLRIRTRLIDEFGIEIGGGLGVFKGKAWRIGLMGESSTQRNVLLVLSALEKLLTQADYNLEVGAAAHAASEVYGQA